ncbi:hypothetical protein SKAU_G00191230 [Synaphobranchus kaupii]|uniref:Uncharacterized protein n=1 Tax=Synaphobranchus kaupii TaxID=118154 RepID=A0A9Q1FDQ4_SYNKA|nr:hypothetical protein SKAU_G00191230 [Synaphobranchus kaupii]
MRYLCVNLEFWRKISTGGRLSLRCWMDDEEDEVFRPVSRCWGAPFREIKHEDRGTQTSNPALRLRDGTLPCGVSVEPRRLFNGNAGFRLHFPALFENVEDQERDWIQDQNTDQEQQQERPGLSSEVRIGRNLQLIGDQFHQERLRLYHRTQRNQQPAWWRTVMTVCSLLFDRGGVVDHGRGVLRCHLYQSAWELPDTSLLVPCRG